MDSLSIAVFDKEIAYIKGVDCVKSGSCPAVRQATLLMYSASHTLFVKHELDIRRYWDTSNDALPVIYRHIRACSWPQLARQNVQGSVSQNARGCCIGLSRGSQPQPYCYAPGAYADFVRLIVAHATNTHPNFQFTSIQINVGLSSVLHTDDANVGPSLVVALGPFTGG